MIEDTSMIYYMNPNGKVQDGNQWLDDHKHGEITLIDLEQLKECYWSSFTQAWTIEEVA